MKYRKQNINKKRKFKPMLKPIAIDIAYSIISILHLHTNISNIKIDGVYQVRSAWVTSHCTRVSNNKVFIAKFAKRILVTMYH